MSSIDFNPSGFPCSSPPPRKKGWQHSEQVLVFYEGNVELQTIDKFGIAYYHYDPPFSGPHWIDFSNTGEPSLWWPLPEKQ